MLIAQHTTGTRGEDVAGSPSVGIRLKRTVAGFAALAVMAGLGAAASPAVAADDPINVALASGENAPAVDVSYVTGWNSAVALNNGRSTATNDYTQMWGTWGAPQNPSQDWATYTWDAPVTVSSSKLYLWQNDITGDSGVMIPSTWKIEYRDSAGEWAPAAGADLSYPVPELDPADPVSSVPAVQADFDAVTTTAVRLVLDRAVVGGEKKATSVIEWEVWGVNAPPEEPEPVDPDAYIDAEAVAVRTTTGTAPELPGEVWTIGENGPLAYAEVTWADIAAAKYAAPGSFEVTGDIAGFEGQPVTAVVQVAEALSSSIESVDYSATITTPGVAPVLPRTVRAHYDDDTIDSTVEVSWREIEAAEFADADAIFDVAGTVPGFADGAVATVFVVAPLEQEAPLVSIGLDSAAQGSGWYTTAPTVTLTVEAAASPIAALEYSTDGTTWVDYIEPFTVDVQGEITLSARATDEGGATGEASQAIKVDTAAPVTGIDFTVVDGTSALVTLTPSDAEPGSGVTRTVWSDGPDASPTGETNNMYATYEEPFSVQLTEEPRYVHVQTQDAAGNVETHVTVELPSLSGEKLELLPVVSHRCVAGKVQLIVSVQNASDLTASVEVKTPFGTKDLTIAAGKKVSSAFAARSADVPVGTVQVTGSADELSYAGSTAYEAAACR